jgi:hypothetical protein
VAASAILTNPWACVTSRTLKRRESVLSAYASRLTRGQGVQPCILCVYRIGGLGVLGQDRVQRLEAAAARGPGAMVKASLEFLCRPARFVMVLVYGFGALAVGCFVSWAVPAIVGAGEDAGPDDVSGCAWRAVVAVLGYFDGQ